MRGGLTRLGILPEAQGATLAAMIGACPCSPLAAGDYWPNPSYPATRCRWRLPTAYLYPTPQLAPLN